MALLAEEWVASYEIRPRPQAIDCHVGLRVRERRIMLGLNQQQLAELMGVTYQQLHKYERGLNRIAAGRLYTIAQALDVQVGFFYEGIGVRPEAGKPTAHQRQLLELTRSFLALTDRRQQEALCILARSLASFDIGAVGESDVAVEDELAQVA